MRNTLNSFIILAALGTISISQAEEKTSSGFMSLVKDKADEKADSEKQKKIEKRTHVRREAPSIPNPSGGSNQAQIIMKIEDECFIVDFDSRPGELIGCTKPLALKYTMRECRSKKFSERGETTASISCPDKQSLEMRFRSSKKLILARLRVRRETEGRSGTVARYQLTQASYEESSITDLLPEPNLIGEDHTPEEESPIDFKVSGFAATEIEFSGRYGYDSTTGQANFDNNVDEAHQNNLNLFANINFELGKDRTHLLSTLEFGEIYFGDTTSGGGVGARGQIVEVRNVYLRHVFPMDFTLNAGIVTTTSDPRSFIFSDHVGSVQLEYKTDLSEGLLWYGIAAQNRPGSAKSYDHYIGLRGTLGFLSMMTGNVFAVVRTLSDETFATSDGLGGFTTIQGDTVMAWMGGTFQYDALKPFGAEATFISNFGHTRLEGADDKYFAYLVDAKMSYLFESINNTLSIEGLLTSGSSGVTESTTGSSLRDARSAFVSPVGATYLLTLATSDGVDSAPGSPKESIIGSLNQEEGVIILVASSSQSWTKKLTTYARYGALFSNKKNSTTNSKMMGHEIDMGGTYQITPSMAAQIDLAYLLPGHYFANHSDAYLGAGKIQFQF